MPLWRLLRRRRLLGDDMRTRRITGAALALALTWSCGGIVLAQQPTSPAPAVQPDRVTAEDREFLAAAIRAGLAEVQLAGLALERSQDVLVRGFAARLVREHRAANRQLLSLAVAAGMMAPARMDQRHQALYQQLARLAGNAFDRRYMQGRVRDHEAAVALFATEATRPRGPVDALAGQLLPMLRRHLELARQVGRLVA